jgi:ribosomal protein S13
MDKINILGTEYIIQKEVDEEQDTRIKNLYGFCDYTTKEICLSKDILNREDSSVSNLKNFENKVLRHEIVHAYLYESGLNENSNKQIAWAENEEMVDWIAIQGPKIFKTFQELNIL